MALLEAEKGKGRTYPNPMVGAVIVKDRKVIAKGYHKNFGGPHAEVIALGKAKKKADGATMYVTLEPCSYFGKTPPCVDRIIDSGIKEVVIGMEDPNPLNSGRGIRELRAHGIRVKKNVLYDKVRRMNRDFISRVNRKRPLISVKVAQSIDGKIAASSGDSKWISSPKSRAMVHKLRAKHDAIMIGIGTLLKDNPRLTVRNSNKKAHTSKVEPFKIIIDGMLRTPADSRIFAKTSPGKVIIACYKNAPKTREKRLRDKGAQILRISKYGKQMELKSLMRQLILKGINSILVEGGGELIASIAKYSFVDKWYIFIAPIIIGGRDTITSVEGAGVESIREAIKLKAIKLSKIDQDFLLEA